MSDTASRCGCQIEDIFIRFLESGELRVVAHSAPPDVNIVILILQPEH